jgi:hypothetical protein
MKIYTVTLTEWNSVGYDDAEMFEHGRWLFADDIQAMNKLVECLVNTYSLELTSPNTWEWGGEFKGLILHLENADVLDMDDVAKVTPPTFTWLSDAQEWYK